MYDLYKTKIRVMTTNIENTKKNIAVIAGGYSGEHDISMGSAGVIIQNINKEEYNPYLIHISKDNWVYVDETKK